MGLCQVISSGGGTGRPHSMARILIADDHPLFRDAIRGVVAQVFADAGWEFSCVEAATVGEVMRAIYVVGA